MVCQFQLVLIGKMHYFAMFRDLNNYIQNVVKLKAGRRSLCGRVEILPCAVHAPKCRTRYLLNVVVIVSKEIRYWVQPSILEAGLEKAVTSSRSRFLDPTFAYRAVLYVAASAVAVVRGATWAAGAVAVAGAMHFALDNDAVRDPVVAVMAVDKKGKYGGDEEEDAVPYVLLVMHLSQQGDADLHDAKCPRRLEHSALAIDVKAIGVSRNGEEPQIVTVGAIGRKVGAVGTRDPSKLIDACNECANEEQVDKRNEVGGVFCARIEEERSKCPCCAENGYDEEDED
jgi:hypothetical protein